MTWSINEEKFDYDLAKYYEGLMTQGNGYMHVRASLEEGIPGMNQAREYDRKPANVTLEAHEYEPNKWGTYVPGIVGRHPYLNTEMINLPYFFEFTFQYKDKVLYAGDDSVLKNTRRLNLKDGVLTRTVLWAPEKGVSFELVYSRYLHARHRHLAVQQIHVRALEGGGELCYSTRINPGVCTNGFNHFVEVERFANGDDSNGLCVSTNGGNKICILQKVIGQTGLYQLPGESAGLLGKIKLEVNEACEITKYVAVCTDHDLEASELVERAKACVEAASKKDVKLLYDEHCSQWQQYWAQSDVVIEGDEKAQRAIRLSIYHLNRAINREDDRIAICAKGYAGEAYFGKYFWDTEISMLPFYLHTDSEAAKNLMRFRYSSLEGAKRNAKAYGYHGARYPWESSLSGDEECACWQYADHEVHVTADIIYALLHYERATGDSSLMEACGNEILLETARYWMDRVDRYPDGTYGLLGVMGPDEYLPITNNNAYTNHMVKFALTEAAKRCETTEEEKNRICEIAQKLRDPAKEQEEIIEQCDGFYELADIDFDEVWKDRSECFGKFVSQEKNYRSKALKQADVLELIQLFETEFTKKQLGQNYDYYEPLTTHDSSLSAAVHGILAARLGKNEDARRFLDKVCDIDLLPEKRGAEEGIHIANCGGLWQLIVYGFAGMKSAMWSEKLELEPNLPEEWSKLSFPILWHGKRRYITITQSNWAISEI